jgi:serine phosphatase RsbU (regulator of sigma subunit)/anti-sigma regulatory factor (Ser/Thr protein kinase)
VVQEVDKKISKRQRIAVRGTVPWALSVSKNIAWGAIAALLLVLHIDSFPASTYRIGVVLALGASALLALLVIVMPGRLPSIRSALVAVGLGLVFTCSTFALLVPYVPAAHAVFVPVIVIAGLVSGTTLALAVAALSTFAYAFISSLRDITPDGATALLVTGNLLLIGWMGGTLASLVRGHLRGEREEHQRLEAIRYRLRALLDAVDEAIVFSDRHGTVRLLNKHAARLFEVSAGDFVGLPVVQLWRTIARQTEDPEGFMESFQTLRDDPGVELKWNVEQLIPQRRVLRIFSSAAMDDDGAIVGRMDVYSDLTETVRNSAEVDRLYREALRIAESYQRALLPTAAPKLPRISFVASYLPAAGRKAVCGDFYDFITSRDGKIGVLLGDVCGIGPEAVNDAALARYTLRSFAPYESNPARLLERTNQRVTDHLGSERFVRLLYGVLDPERATLEYANAGHVPPLLYRARSGEVEWLGEGGLPMGIERGTEYKVGKIQLEPGDLIFIYTDGVTEAPRNGRPLGQGRLSDLVGEYGVGTPGELVQAIRRAVEAWVDEDLRDDLAMLSFQVVPDVAADGLMRELVIPNEPRRAREARDFVAEFLADLRAPVEVSYDVLLAVGEAAGNAVKYGIREEVRSEIRVRCQLEGGEVRVAVADEGRGFDLASIESEKVDPFASGGRGLFLMKQLVDEVDIKSTDSGTTVTLTHRVFAR